MKPFQIINGNGRFMNATEPIMYPAPWDWIPVVVVNSIHSFPLVPSPFSLPIYSNII
jgi:hypothetical protein